MKRHRHIFALLLASLVSTNAIANEKVWYNAVEGGLYLGIGDSNGGVGEFSIGKKDGWRGFLHFKFSNARDFDQHSNNDENEYGGAVGTIYRWNVSRHVFDAGIGYVPQEADLFHNRNGVVISRYHYRISRSVPCGISRISAPFENDRGGNQIGCSYLQIF